MQARRAFDEALRARGEDEEADRHARRAKLIRSQLAGSIDDPVVKESFCGLNPADRRGQS